MARTLFCDDCLAIIAADDRPPADCLSCAPPWVEKYKDNFCLSCLDKIRNGKAISPCGECYALRAKKSPLMASQ